MFIRQNLKVSAKYPWSLGSSCQLKALSSTVSGRHSSCQSKTFFTPKNYNISALLGRLSSFRCMKEQSPKNEETYLCCSSQRNSPRTALFSDGWSLVLADILHFFLLSPVAAVANKSLSASIAWNCARSSWRSCHSPGATPDPASKNQEGFSKKRGPREPAYHAMPHG